MSGRGRSSDREPPGAPLRIHRVIARLNVGGPAMHVVNLARSLNDGVRFRTRLIAGTVPPSEGDMEYYAAERGVEVTRVPRMSRAVRPLDDAAALTRLVRLFREDRPHVVHTHTAKAGALGRIAAALTRVPVRIHTFHGHVLGGDYFSPPVTSLYRGVERGLARLSDRLVVLSEGQRRELAEEYRIAPPERFRVIPLGLELAPFLSVDRERDGAAAREELGLAPGTRVVGSVGRLAPVKNHDLLLRALARLPERPVRGSRASEAAEGDAEEGSPGGSPVRLLMVGGGEREEELRRLAARLGVGDRVRWLGWRTDLPRLYAAMDVLALTSHDEGTPVAVIEALAAGTPVVARSVGGVPEVLEGGRLGRLVEDEDPDAFAEALRLAIFTEPSPAEAPGAPTLTPDDREKVGRRYSVERLADDLARLYEEEIGRARSYPQG